MEKQIESYRIFQGFYLAFYSKRFYRAISQQWKWRSLLHLVVLLLILWAFMVARISYNFHQSAHVLFSTAAKQVPTLMIKDGVASMKKSGTVTVIYPGTGNVFALVNMEKSAKALAAEPTTAMVFITRHGVGVRGFNNKLTIKPYPKNYTGKFGPKELEAFYQSHRTEALILFALMSYFFVFPVFFVFVLFFISILTTLLRLITSALSAQPSWPGCFALACAAATPFLIVTAIAFSVNALSTLLLLVMLLAQFIYLMVIAGFVESLYKFKN